MSRLRQRDYVLEAKMRVGVTATSLKKAIEYLEQSEGAPIDSDAIVLAVLDIRNVPASEGH